MMRATTAAVASSSFFEGCGSSSRLRLRGMLPRLLQSSSVVVFFNNYLALFHSRASKSPESRNTQQRQPVNIANVFNEMLQRRPLPSVVPFNQILTQLAKLKHYSAVISLNNQLVVSGIRPNVYTLNIICFCHLRKMGFGFSILGKFFKLGFEPTVTTFNTLINGFIRDQREAGAAALFNKMMEGGNCKPDVVTFSILAKGYCLKGNNQELSSCLRRWKKAITGLM